MTPTVPIPDNSETFDMTAYREKIPGLGKFDRIYRIEWLDTTREYYRGIVVCERDGEEDESEEYWLDIDWDTSIAEESERKARAAIKELTWIASRARRPA